MPQQRQSGHAMSGGEWAMLLVLSAVWGGSFFFNEIALRELPVLALVTARTGIAALILLLIMRIRGEALPRGARIWASLVVMALLNNVIPFSMIAGAQQHIPSGAASILNASTPFFGVILTHYLTADERLTTARLLGAVIGFAGVAVMIGPSAWQGMGEHLGPELLCLGGAFFYACAGIYGRRFRAMGLSALGTATGQVTLSTLILLPLMLAVDRPWTLPMPGPATVAAVLGVAAISTAFAYLLFFRILATAGATNIMLVTLLIPVSAILLGTIVLDEALQPRQFLGMALIGLGLAAIDGRLWRRLCGGILRG